jgi:hypothetical protein
MATVTFQFSRPDLSCETTWNRVVSEGICKMTRSEICHVDLVDIKADGSYTLLGAHIDGGFQERGPDYQKWGLRIRVTVPCSDEQEAMVCAAAHAMIGTPYDTADIEGIAFGNSALHVDGKLICSGAGSILIDEKSKILRVAKVHWQVSPEELRIAMTAFPGAVETRIEGNVTA